MLRQLKNFDLPFFKKALKVFLPVFLATIVTSSISFVDNIVVNQSTVNDVGNFKQIDYIAVGVANELYFLFSSFAVGISILFSILYGQFVNRQKDFSDSTKFNFWFIVSVSLIISFVMFVWAEDFINLFYLGKQEAKDVYVKKHAINYIKILSLGHLFFAWTINILNPLTIKGKVKYQLWLSLLSLLLNIILDYIFIYVMKLGAEGSAWATNIAYFAQFVAVIFITLKHKEWFKGFWNLFYINKRIVIEGFKRLPICIFFILMSISFVSTTMIWSSLYSSSLLISLATGYLIANLLFAVFPAITKSVSIFIGPLLGDAKFKEAKKMSQKLLAVNFFLSVISILGAILVNLFFPKLMIQDSKEVQNAEWIIYSFAFALLGHMFTTYYSAIHEIGGLQLVPNIWNRGFYLWLVIPAIFLFSPLGINLSFKTNFLISNLISYLSAVVCYISFKRYKWLHQIKTSNLKK